jgi:hypothetical protein
MRGVDGVHRFLNRVWRLFIDDRAESARLNDTVRDVQPGPILTPGTAGHRRRPADRQHRQQAPPGEVKPGCRPWAHESAVSRDR